ncbi:hypothetical protein [Streptomyces mirabilis]|uniref:hypothetical protein n=1 Tax=Streptomyces mirabilis TaxID=68239 RepID=UPI0033F3C04E
MVGIFGISTSICITTPTALSEPAATEVASRTVHTGRRRVMDGGNRGSATRRSTSTKATSVISAPAM